MKSLTIENGMKFINDEKVIGKWEHFAVINSKDKFDFNTETPLTDKAFKEIYFLENGQKYWIFEGWTKGFLLIHYGGNEPILCYKYSILEKDNKQFLFIEIAVENPYICVLIKVSDSHYKINEIGQRDNIKLPFVLDENVVGSWQSVGFVNNIEDFNPNSPSEELWLKEIHFKNNGNAIRIYSDENETWEDKWTQNFLLDCKKSTASKYIVKPIDKKLYLFVEWKMGNYVYGGAKPNYYVFIKI